MKHSIFTRLEPSLHQPSVITIGNFDGVHMGHRLIFETVVNKAKEQSANALVFSFDPHPRELLSQVRLALITTLQQRADIIEQSFETLVYGAINFDTQLSQLSPEAFLQELIDTFSMKTLVVGSTTHIGKDRQGTPARIQELSRKMGFDVIVMEPLTIDGHVVSSSLIRNLIIKGDVHRIEPYLGRLFETQGVVEHGQKIGRSMGFPTANLRCFASQLLPANGVYAVWAYVDGKKFPGAVNLGYRPTVEADNVHRNLEVHLIGEDADLYGQDVRVAWVQRVRDEVKFNSLTELHEQIQLDVTKIKEILT